MLSAANMPIHDFRVKRQYNWETMSDEGPGTFWRSLQCGHEPMIQQLTAIYNYLILYVFPVRLMCQHRGKLLQRCAANLLLSNHEQVDYQFAVIMMPELDVFLVKLDKFVSELHEGHTHS